MRSKSFARCLLASLFAITITVNCGGSEGESSETGVNPSSSTISQVDEPADSTDGTQSVPTNDVDESGSNTDDPLVVLLADEFMNDPDAPPGLSEETAICIAQFVVDTTGISGLSDLEQLENDSADIDSLWMQGLTDCLDSEEVLHLFVAELGGTEEQTACLLNSLGDNTDDLVALFSSDGQPESDEEMAFIFTLMAAAIECGIDIMDDAEMGFDDGSFDEDDEYSASWEIIPHPICPNGEPCVCIDVDGSCDDGDDDWGWINLGEEEYFCSNDGKDYAELMGGSLCADTAENA